MRLVSAASFDPREHVIRLGNELLDAIYKHQVDHRRAGELVAAFDDPDPARRPNVREAAPFALDGLRHVERIKQLTAEYATSRQLVEATDASEARR